MAEDQGSKKRPKKSHYVSSNKKRHADYNLSAGMRGVLITCNEKKERYSVREAYNILNEYADKIYDKEVKEDGNNSSSEEEDIEKAIDKEKNKMKSALKRFQSVKCSAKNVLFIKTALPNEEDPSKLVHTILSDVLENGLNKSRDCMRFLPISASCYASLKEIENTAEELFKLSFLDPNSNPCKFCVVYKSRNNNNIHRDEVIATLAQIILNSGMDHSVDLHNPDLTVCVEIVRNICCLSVVKDFNRLKKYNIQEIQKSTQDDSKQASNEIKISESNTNKNTEQKQSEKSEDIKLQPLQKEEHQENL